MTAGEPSEGRPPAPSEGRPPAPSEGRPRSRDLVPLDVDGVRTVAVGTVLWALAGLVLLLRRDALVADGHEEWLWVCVAGAGLGLLGVAYCRRRRDRLRGRSRSRH